MKRLFLIISTLTLVITHSASAQGDDTIVTGTVDVWSNDARSWLIGEKRINEGYSWENCREAVAQMINDCGYDIFGVQSLDQLGRDDIPRLLKKLNKNYKWWWCIADPYNTADQARNSANCIVYRKDRFKLSKQRSFWLSETPDQLSTGWGEGRFVRIAICTEVLDKQTGKRFYMISTSWSGRRATNDKCGALVIEREKMYNKEGLPSILVGNLACRHTAVSSSALREHYEDSFFVAPGNKTNIAGNDLSAKIIEGNIKSAKNRMHYVYTRSGKDCKCEVLSYDLNTKKYKNKLGQEVFPSRVLPTIVKLRLK